MNCNFSKTKHAEFNCKATGGTSDVKAVMKINTQLTCLMLNPNSCQLCFADTEKKYHQTQTHDCKKKTQNLNRKRLSQLPASSSLLCKNKSHPPCESLSLFFSPPLTHHACF